jgi:hypothetical protein
LVNEDVILRKIADLETYQDQLGEFSGMTVAAYRADWKAQRINVSLRVSDMIIPRAS